MGAPDCSLAYLYVFKCVDILRCKSMIRIATSCAGGGLVHCSTVTALIFLTNAVR